MSKPHAARRQLARLTFEDGEVVVTPRDRSVFLINAEKATEACREALSREEALYAFDNDFLIPLHQWCVDNSNRIRACYVPTPATDIKVYIVTNNVEFDLELAEKVAQLELQLANAGWRVGIFQLPAAEEPSLATFFNQDGVLEVYAQLGSAPQEGGE